MSFYTGEPGPRRYIALRHIRVQDPIAMTTPDATFRILYVSQLAPGSELGTVSDIVATSRTNNPLRGITGALVFDGEYFGQLLEGDEAEVSALMQRIATDPRHVRVVLLLSGVTAVRPRMRVWRSGYCDPQRLGALTTEPALRGPAALEAFMSILAGADLE